MRMLRIGLVSSLVLAACGGDAVVEDETPDDTTGGEATEGTATEAGPALADMAWHDVPEDQRGRWMAEVVVPTMRPLFQEHDAEEFAEFGCATCHGEDARDVHFEMPNGVHPLTGAEIQAAFQSDEPMDQFMTQTVWPRMTELLGEQPYDPETHQGFSCMNCHENAEGDAH